LIRGFFDPDDARRLPQVRVALLVPSLMSTYSFVTFVVDTGAMVTTLHPLDISRHVGVDPSRLRAILPEAAAERIQGVGGHIEALAVPAMYALLHDNNAFQYIRGQIRSVPLTPTSAPLPSLLGWDLLRHFRLEVDYRSGWFALE
jgi:hypothetical protein